MAESAAAWFRHSRLRAGYRSQAQLARTLGLARAAVANWESPTVAGRPSRTLLPQLARLLGVSQDELAARFGIDTEPGWPPRQALDPEIARAIEEAVARGVARGVTDALAQLRADESAPDSGVTDEERYRP